MIAENEPFAATIVNTSQIVPQFLFNDSNLFVKATDTILYCVHVSVLRYASTYFIQVLDEADRIGGMAELDLSEECVTNIQYLLGTIYNIAEWVICISFSIMNDNRH